MRGLIIVDIQKDLLPGGALPVPKGSEVIPYINSIMDKFKTVVSTQRSIQRPYDLNSQPLISAPDYCLHDSVGSELSEDLKITKIHKNFIKGFNPLEGTDSGFKNTYDGLNLYQYLKGKQISEVFVVGLSLDYAVKETALDAHRLGFKTNILLRGTRPLNFNPKDGNQALQELSSEGITIRSDLPVILYVQGE